mgnify:CR=1 FL=1
MRKSCACGTCVRSSMDEAGDNDFVIVADVDLDATQEGDGVVFANYRVGFADELLDEF